jgi:hypothetical protein
MKTNPSDIYELISRGGADPLTDAERAIIDRAIAADPGLASERDAYTRLDALLARFAILPNDVDWDELSGIIAAEIRDEADLASEFDNDAEPLIEALSQPIPQVEWNAFHARVSSAVRDEAALQQSSRTIKWPAAFAWVAPLAAAALIAIVVWSPFGIGSNPQDSTNPVVPSAPIAVVEVEFGAPRPSGIVAIAFDESSPDEAPAPESKVVPGGTVIVDGSWPTEDPALQVDVEAYYY